MAITGGANVETENNEDLKAESLKTKYLEKNNVVDIAKSELKTLKSGLKLDEETNLQTVLTKVNDHAENFFDGYVFNNRKNNVTLTVDGKEVTDTVKNIIASGDKDKLNALANFIMDKSGYATDLEPLKDQEIKAVLTDYKFELNDLRNEVNANTSTKTETTITKETRDKNNTYKYAPEDYSLTELGDKGKIYYNYGNIDDVGNNAKLLDVFKKGGLQGQIEKLLKGNLGGQKVSDFKIDLSPEHGLTGLISYIDKNNKWGDITSGKDVKNLAPDFTYRREGGLDNERGKIAKIIQAANNDASFKAQLVDFATEAKSFGANYEKSFKQEINFSAESLTTGNVLEALCDFNGDGKLATNYTEYAKRKEHRDAWKTEHSPLAYNWRELWKKDRETEKEKEKKDRKENNGVENQGDVGTIFGPQLYDAIQTASNVAEVKLTYDVNRKKIKERYGNITGENIVISNILNQISSFNEDKKLEDAINTLIGKEGTTLNVANCTPENFLKLCQDHPSFQPLFVEAITTINGSSNILAPDLVNTLSGITEIYDLGSKETKEEKTSTEATTNTSDIFEAVLNDIATKNNPATPGNEVVQNFIKEYPGEGLLQMRKGMMTMFDNVNISAMLNDQGKLLSLKIDKSWDLQKREHELKNSFAKTLLGALASVTFNPATLSVGFAFGESNTTNELKNKRSWTSDVSTYLGGKVIQISVGGSEARQFNYHNIITNSLDADPLSAKYVGVEGGASKIFVLGQKGISINVVEGGINYQRDRKAAIEQMYKQYSKVTDILFNLDNHELGSTLSPATATDVDTKDHLSKFLETRYQALYSSLSTSKDKSDIHMAEFLDNNKTFIQTNIDQITQYFDKNGIFSAILIGSMDHIKATKAVLNIFKDGITNTWRETMYESLNGTTQLTKVELGIGAMFIKGTKPVLYPKFSLQFTHRRNHYINDAGQKNLDATLIGEGRIIPKIDTFTPDFTNLDEKERASAYVNAYAEYLQAMYNLGNVKNEDGSNKLNEQGKTIPVLETGKTDDGLLYMKYNGTAVNNITDIIDVRAKVKQTILDNIKISTDGKTMTLGDVGNITAYTQADGEGKRCFLILGGTDMANTTRLTPSLHTKNTPKNMTFTESTTYETFDKNDIETKILTSFSAADKAEVSQFFATDGSIQTAGKTVVFNGIAAGDKLTTGTLAVDKAADGTYTLTLSSSPTDKKLTINYTDLATAKEQWTPTTIDFSKVDFFSAESYPELTDAQTTMDGLRESLSKLDTLPSGENKDAYLKFMTYISNISDGETIDKTEIDKSIKELKDPSMLGTGFETLVKILDSGEYMTKSRVVDQLKTIFAFEESYLETPLKYIVEGGTYDGKFYGSRGDMFQTLVGPSKEKLPTKLSTEMKTLRTDILDAHGSDIFNANPKPITNLLGYTAFYRYGKIVENKNQRYSMTCLGETSAQTDPVDISADNEESARTWFIDNLKANKYEMDLFKEIIGKQTNLDLKDIASEQLGNLLSGKEVSIDKDNKISITSKCVFYLAGQCANESLGLEIETLTLNGKTFVPSSTGEGSGLQSLTASTVMAGKNLSSAMKVGSYGEQLGLNIGIIPTEKKSTSQTTAGTSEEGEESTTGAGVGK